LSRFRANALQALPGGRSAPQCPALELDL